MSGLPTIPVLWVNADALADERHIGINAVRADHQDRRHYTVPLYAQPPAPAVVDTEREAFIRGYKHGACSYIGGDSTEELHEAASWAVDHQSDDAGVFATPAVPIADVEQRAKSLLYAEYAKPWFNGNYEDAAIDAIVAALRSQGQADATELRGIRDTLIVAANNPLSHGGIRGLREIMLTQARRITAALAQQANKERT